MGRALRLVPCLLSALLVSVPGSLRAAPLAAAPVDSATWVDHDAGPIPEPEEREKDVYGYYFREAFVEPVINFFDVPDKILWLLDKLGVESDREAVNVNTWDEVPNSTWFTNRNHVRAVPLEEIRRGPLDGARPEFPWTVKSIKASGVNPGFNIKDAAGERWVVKFDPPGYPGMGSRADIVSSRLLLAAGYNLPHDVVTSFHREDLRIDEDLAKGEDGNPPFTDAGLESLLARGHRSADGSYSALASHFLPGKPVGHMQHRGRRPDDPNDRYTHPNRRELRGLYVLASWLDHWDAKEQQSLDVFEERADSLGAVRHCLLDVNATLGSAARGPKRPQMGFENRVDYEWIGRRFVTLGFLEEPWRRARTPEDLPSVGRFESAEFRPEKFKPYIRNPVFHEMTERDAYWGAKLVASFSDAQIRTAVGAAGYEDPRSRDYLLRTLIERRDKIARYWFGRVAPLDFFDTSDGALVFRDLAVDRGLVPARRYEVRVEALGGRVPAELVRLEGTVFRLQDLGEEAGRVRLSFSIEGADARPTSVELTREEGEWVVIGVRHG